jgi:hypothetical protein
MRNNIAGKKIPCKPQKVQGFFATVEIRRGIWRKVGQAGRKKWLPCHGQIVEQSRIGGGGGDEPEPDEAQWLERTRSG